MRLQGTQWVQKSKIELLSLAMLAKLLLTCFALVVLVGLIAVVIPAFETSFTPINASPTNNTLINWHQFPAFYALFTEPNVVKMMQLSLFTGIVSTVLALLICLLLLKWLCQTERFIFGHLLCLPLFVIPHSALAIAVGLLLSPSSLLARCSAWLSNIWLSNTSFYQDALSPLTLLPSTQFPLPNDPYGISIILALVLKELPFLWFIAFGIFTYKPAKSMLQTAQTLGVPFSTAFNWVVLPMIYRNLRLPLCCVFIYAATNIEIATLLGPSQPTTFAVYILTRFQSPEIGAANEAAAAALLLFLACLIVIGLALLLERIGRYQLGILLMTRNHRKQANHIDNAQHGCKNRSKNFVRQWCKKSLENLIAKSIYIVICLFLLFALSNLILLSFAEYWPYPNILPNRFQMQHWQQSVTALTVPIFNTVWIAFWAMLISHTFALILLEASSSSSKKVTSKLRHNYLQQMILYLPLMLPAVGFLFGLVWLLRGLNLPLNIFTVIMSHVLFIAPYSYFTLQGNFQQYDARYSQVAITLGKSPLHVFFCVKLRILLAQLLFSSALALLISFNQYLPTILLGGASIETLSTEAIISAQGGSRRLMAVYSLLQIAISTSVVLLFKSKLLNLFR